MHVFLAAQAHANNRGFLSKEITVRSMLEHRGDTHHVHPKNYLKQQDHKRGSYNQLANYVYMQQENNIAIRYQPVETYLAAVKSQCETKKPVYGGIVNADDLKRNFEENAVPTELLVDERLPSSPRDDKNPDATDLSNCASCFPLSKGATRALSLDGCRHDST